MIDMFSVIDLILNTAEQDKTFGLKNKKGAKQQKFVKQVNQQVRLGNDISARKVEQQRQEERKKKEQDKKKQAEIDSLFRPVLVQKIEKGNYVSITNITPKKQPLSKL